MGTRCGDLDPAVVLYIQNATGRGSKEVDKLMNKESGLLGLSGKSDIRAILEESANGNERASLAMNVSSNGSTNCCQAQVKGALQFRGMAGVSVACVTYSRA